MTVRLWKEVPTDQLGLAVTMRSHGKTWGHIAERLFGRRWPWQAVRRATIVYYGRQI